MSLEETLANTYKVKLEFYVLKTWMELGILNQRNGISIIPINDSKIKLFFT
jgi:hypothetical protein